MRKTVIPFLLAFACVAAPAFAKTMTSSSAKVSFDEPKGWHHKGDGDAITILDKDEDVAIAFMAVGDHAVDKATEALGKQLKNSVQNLKWEEEKKTEINGMKGISMAGDGMVDGKSVDLVVVVLNTPSPDHDLIVLAIGEDARIAKHGDEIKAVFKSIKPVK